MFNHIINILDFSFLRKKYDSGICICYFLVAFFLNCLCSLKIFSYVCFFLNFQFFFSDHSIILFFDLEQSFRDFFGNIFSRQVSRGTKCLCQNLSFSFADHSDVCMCRNFFYGFKALHFGCFFVLVIPDLITDPSVSVKSHKK